MGEPRKYPVQRKVHTRTTCRWCRQSDAETTRGFDVVMTQGLTFAERERMDTWLRWLA